jgi:broad specificity phosphatase PhoE
MLLPSGFRMGALYLIRHASPAVEGVLLGQSDPPLSEQGRAQAREALSRLEVARAYTSPLRRAVETAAFLRPPASVLDGLAEISLGAWDGKSWAEVERADPALAHRKSEDWFRVAAPGGESWEVFTARVLGALDIALAGPRPAAIVAHWAVNSVIASKLAGASTSRFQPAQFQQAYCEVIEFDV